MFKEVANGAAVFSLLHTGKKAKRDLDTHSFDAIEISRNTLLSLVIKSQLPRLKEVGACENELG